MRCISIPHKLCPEQELRFALLWNRPVCRTLSVLLFELTYLHVIGSCPPHGSNPGEVQLFPAAAWVFGCGLACCREKSSWCFGAGRGDRKLRTGFRHHRPTGRCGSRKLRARRVDHGSPPSTLFRGVKETLVLLHTKGVRNRSSCLHEVPGEDAHHQCIDHPESWKLDNRRSTSGRHFFLSGESLTR